MTGDDWSVPLCTCIAYCNVCILENMCSKYHCTLLLILCSHLLSICMTHPFNFIMQINKHLGSSGISCHLDKHILASGRFSSYESTSLSHSRVLRFCTVLLGYVLKELCGHYISLCLCNGMVRWFNELAHVWLCK